MSKKKENKKGVGTAKELGRLLKNTEKLATVANDAVALVKEIGVDAFTDAPENDRMFDLVADFCAMSSIIMDCLKNVEKIAPDLTEDKET